MPSSGMTYQPFFRHLHNRNFAQPTHMWFWIIPMSSARNMWRGCALNADYSFSKIHGFQGISFTEKFEGR